MDVGKADANINFKDKKTRLDCRVFIFIEILFEFPKGITQQLLLQNQQSSGLPPTLRDPSVPE